MKTNAGLEVKVALNEYKKGKKISKKQLEFLNIKGDKFHPEWNYSISPQK